MSWAIRRAVLPNEAANSVDVTECFTDNPTLLSNDYHQPRSILGVLFYFCYDDLETVVLMMSADILNRPGEKRPKDASEESLKTPASSIGTGRPTPSASPSLDAPGESSTSLGTPTSSDSSISTSRSTLDLMRSTGQVEVSTVVKTAVIVKTSTASDPAPPLITSKPRDSLKATDGAVIAPTIIDSSVIAAPPAQSTTDAPLAAQENPPHRQEDEHPPLSNGATAGIVLAVVAVLLATFFLVRCIYKRRGFFRRNRPFSPIREPYHRPNAGSISHPVPQHNQLHSWLSHPRGPAYPGVAVSPGREESVELQTFTRPVHGPRMYDIGHSGNAPISPAYASPPLQDGREEAPATMLPQQTGQDVPVSPESPTPSSMGQNGRLASPRDRTGAIPWEDGYPNRYAAW